MSNIVGKALELAKGTDEPKVGLSVQVPKSLKDDFERICKKEDVSMSSMLLSLIQVVVDDVVENEKVTEQLETRYFSLENRVKKLQGMYDDAVKLGLEKEDSAKSIKEELDELKEEFEQVKSDLGYAHNKYEMI